MKRIPRVLLRKANKYLNKKTVIDGVTFDSKKEANVYLKLKMLERAGQVTDIKLQKKYLLIPAQKQRARTTLKSASYYADFVYKEDGKIVVVDVKSAGTRKLPGYVLKKKLMKWIHDIEIIEV